jgi:predicted XRE-type DNA-binding protein
MTDMIADRFAPAGEGAGLADNLVKAQLVRKVTALMRERGLKQIEAAGLFGVKQPDVSRLLAGNVSQFSIERLLRFLVALGQDVQIVVRPRESDHAPTLRVD